MMRDLRARTALAAEQQRRRGLIRVAAREAARIAGEDASYATAFDCRIEAAIAAARGRRDDAIVFLQRAAAGFDEHDLGLHAVATRSRLGMIVEGNAGAALRDESARLMREQSIRRTDRFSDMFVPAMTKNS